ncbi:transposase [Sphingobium sp. BS19]|jgi:transposase|uniref:IS66-like element accessory protein TnpA n=1 Tax=Sphingobium sp. BS19 TaxID=3018973 RepID=UPI0022EE5451|nr:transposase [Sphingobium sp. BS19]GLI98784.1 transposase [Sphingobium sp. BS19]
MGQVTVFSGPERRRRWSDDERLRILSEAFSPGACVARVAQRHDVSTSLVYTWRRKLRAASTEPTMTERSAPQFAEAMMAPEPGSARPSLNPAIVVDLARGNRVSIFPSASPALVAAALRALR